MAPLTTISENYEKKKPEVRTLQWLRGHRAEQYQVPHRHGYLEIIWIKKGNGHVNIDCKEYQMHDNTLYCIVPDQLHRLEIGDHTEGYIVILPELLFCAGNVDVELLYRSGLLPSLAHCPGLQIEEEVAEEIEQTLHWLSKERSRTCVLQAEIVRRYIDILLICLARQFRGAIPESPVNREMHLARNFYALVEKDFKSRKLVKEYAEELLVTSNHLNNVVKKVTGYPASHYIRQRVVLEAKRSAVYSDLNMKAIAFSLGFSDVSHFSKFFRNTYGKSFSDFRKEKVLP